MTASRLTVDNDSRPSVPTLDLHTDAIIMREGAGAAGSTYLCGSSSCPTSTPTPTPTSVSLATPTASERSPFIGRQSAFRAAPIITVGTVGPSPAMQRVRLREEAAQRAASVVLRGPGGAVVARRGGGSRSRTAEASLPWPVLAAFAIGAAMAVAAQLVGDDLGVELAALAAVLAGTRTLVAALPGRSGKSHARASTAPRH
jgi:hypothetical protein